MPRAGLSCAPFRWRRCLRFQKRDSRQVGLQHFVSALFRGGVALESLLPFSASGEGYQYAVGRHKVRGGLHALPVAALLKKVDRTIGGTDIPPHRWGLPHVFLQHFHKQKIMYSRLALAANT